MLIAHFMTEPDTSDPITKLLYCFIDKHLHLHWYSC